MQICGEAPAAFKKSIKFNFFLSTTVPPPPPHFVRKSSANKIFEFSGGRVQNKPEGMIYWNLKSPADSGPLIKHKAQEIR